MKLILLFLILFLGGCDTPKEVAVRTPPKPTTDTTLLSKPVSVEPLLDTTSLRIEVVHNPKYPNTYGIGLINLDTSTSIQLQKVILDTTEKLYPTPCPSQTEAELIAKFDYDYCLVEFGRPTTFAMTLPDFVPSPLKCQVYYVINGVKKVNYHWKVDTIKCRIGYSYGIHPEPNQECIWSIGWNN